jgi:hypothetical protein
VARWRGGLYERIFLGIELLWIAIAAWHIATKQPTAAAART